MSWPAHGIDVMALESVADDSKQEEAGGMAYGAACRGITKLTRIRQYLLRTRAAAGVEGEVFSFDDQRLPVSLLEIRECRLGNP